MGTYIKKISMTGFKSFGDRTVTVKLSSGFTCIVGPNGAGKSNIIDALCFALGRLSKKTMRAKSLEDLIFAGSKGKNPSNRASVTLSFDNSEGVFPGGTEEDFTITRTIKRGGGGGYKMNGNKSTRQQILNALAVSNIDPDGTNQFVLQGKIVELTHMNSEDRRKFIEELIGLQKYDEMKEATLKELEKAERDLGQFEAIFKEVSSQLKKVEKEKNDALEWRELENQINNYNAQLIALKILKLQEEEKAIDKDIENISKVIEELNEKITKHDEILKQESLVMDNIQKSIAEKEIERENINESITKLKEELSSNKTTLNLAKKSIKKLTQDREKLENLLMKLEEGKTFDSLKDGVLKEISDLDVRLEEAKIDIEKRQQTQTELDIKIKNNEDKKSNFNAEISKIKQDISSNEAQIVVLKENIKKNESKKMNLKQELEKLKGNAENIDNAIEATKKIEDEIRKRINDLKSITSEENQKQKKLENNITVAQMEKNQLNSKLSDLKAILSSLNTEIKMNKLTIEDLKEKKSVSQNKIKDLSKGKDTEEILKDSLNKREEINNHLIELKNKSKVENSSYRKNEQNLELLKMKQGSIDAEINDNKGKISNLNTELKIFEKELTNLEREKHNLELNVNSLNNDLSKTKNELNNLRIKEENIQRRLEELTKEKRALVVRIDNSEKEYEKNTEDIRGILQILSMLTQNIHVSVESIKGNIQQSNAEAIELSAEDYKKFVLDIIDIMKTLETISSTDTTPELSETINSMVHTLGIFTEHADSTIEQLINKVKESSDVAIQESTSNFDSFVMDLMEILENIHISLRKLTISKNKELYKQLEEISDNIKGQEDNLNDFEKKIAQINIQNKHDSENLSASSQRLEGVNKNIEELNEKIEKYKKEIEERDKIIKDKLDEYKKLNVEINDLKELKESYWERVSEIQENIEITQSELDDVQEKLQELQGIHTLFGNIEEIDNIIRELTNTTEEKKNIIIKTEENINKLQSEKNSLQKDIESFNSDKTKFWEITENIQTQIDEENKNLEKTMDQLRSLENVKRNLNSIEELTKENIEAKNNIETCKKNLELFNSKANEIQKDIDGVQQVIDLLRNEKVKELDAQKVAQKKLNELNKELQKTLEKLHELNKNKEREQQIVTIKEDIKTTEQQVESTVEEIKKLNENLTNVEKKKEAKQGEIDKLIQEKDHSWNNQKQYQKILNILKSDLSMENSKMNNYESKKIICTDQIKTLYERSKDYGKLPRIADDLSEEMLQKDISLATEKKKALEPVNLKAIDQYDAVKERFDEIDMRRQTIQRERKSILNAIDKIELEKTRTFMKAYHEINREFSRIFQKLSPGGSAKMILDRPDKPFEGGISIEARPRGKKIS